MNRILSSALALLLLASPMTALAQAGATPGAATLATGPAVTKGEIEVSGGYSRATLPNAPVGAGYFTIKNFGQTDEKLLSASSPVAGVTQIHTMRMEGDVMKMSELPDGVVITGGTVAFAPGGYHIMFMELKEPLVEGTSIPLTLNFQNAGAVNIELVVGPINASAGH